MVALVVSVSIRVSLEVSLYYSLEDVGIIIRANTGGDWGGCILNRVQRATSDYW